MLPAFLAPSSPLLPVALSTTASCLLPSFLRPFRPATSRPRPVALTPTAASAPAGDATEFPRRPLGSSSLLVTPVCLGTMTWGIQNTPEDAFAQLDYAVKTRGINFIDTAEMYPVPGSHPKWVAGATEIIIGDWLAQDANKSLRKDLVIATKIAGYMPSSGVPGQRTDPPTPGQMPCRLDRDSIRAACAASLRRLKTDYIDLYQLHWPERAVGFFGSSGYDPENEREDVVSIRETLLALKELLEEGKIREYGLSNETPFGVCEFVRLADELKMPRPVSIQNEFHLLNRTFEDGLAEACAPNHLNVGLMPWSVLAGGSLSGKYLGGERPAGSRFTLFPAFMRRFCADEVMPTIGRYKEVADKAGVSLATLAVAFCRSRYYIDRHGSCIVGATTLEQLKENIDGYNVRLSDEVLEAIDEIHFERKSPVVR